MLDPIPTSLLKQCLDELVLLVTATVNASLSTSTVLTQSKQVIVIPFLKKSGLDTNNLKHFRLVSNCHLFESFLRKLFWDSFRNACLVSLLEMCQSAYRKDHNIETCCAECSWLPVSEGRWEACLSDCHIGDSTAFSTLDHSILLVTFTVSSVALVVCIPCP